MASRGRPRLSGERRKNGRRVITPVYDRGSDHVQALRNRFAKFCDGKASQQVYDPIGRAWAVGLLENDRVDPAVLRDAGRRYAQAYWRHYPAPQGVANYEREIRRGNGFDGGEKFTSLDRQLEDAGRASYSAVQSLTCDQHWFPDANPAWLDRLINDRLAKAGATVHGQLSVSGDARQLSNALAGLLALAGEMRAAA